MPGAKGFVDLLEGIAEFVDGGPRAIRMRGANAPAANEASEVVIHGHRRRSAASLVQRMPAAGRGAGSRPPARGTGSDLAPIPSSSPAARSGCACMRMRRIRRPCSMPAPRFGQVEAMKADDMLRQQRSAARGCEWPSSLTAPPTCPKRIAERHAHRAWCRRASTWTAATTWTRSACRTHEFYRRMAESRQLPRTSQPPPGDFMRQFELALAHHPQVVYVGLSRAVSGTLQSGEHAARAQLTADACSVFDTFNAAGGQALLVVACGGNGRDGRRCGRDPGGTRAPASADPALGDDPRHQPCGARRAHSRLGRAAGPAQRADAGGANRARTASWDFPARCSRAQARTGGLRPQRRPQAAEWQCVGG